MSRSNAVSQQLLQNLHLLHRSVEHVVSSLCSILEPTALCCVPCTRRSHMPTKRTLLLTACCNELYELVHDLLLCTFFTIHCTTLTSTGRAAWAFSLHFGIGLGTQNGTPTWRSIA
jgi:hypothetical protein